MKIQTKVFAYLGLWCVIFPSACSSSDVGISKELYGDYVKVLGKAIGHAEFLISQQNM